MGCPWPSSAVCKKKFSRGSSDDKACFARLQDIRTFAEQNCELWRDLAPPEHSKTSGQILHMDVLNLYHMCAWCILPATHVDNCSFVEPPSRLQCACLECRGCMSRKSELAKAPGRRRSNSQLVLQSLVA